MKRLSAKIAKEMTDCIEGKLPKEAGYMATKPVPTVYLLRWLQTLAPIPRKPRPITKCSLERKANRATTKQLDDLWKAIVRQRDGGLCRRCKKTERLQAHHIFSRRHRKLRWTSTNGLLLCSGCHLWVHGRTGAGTVEIARWLEEQVGTREYLKLAQIKESRGKGPDLNLMRIYLTKELG